MRILIYTGHPADFHLFKNVATLLKKNGWEVYLLTRNKDLTLPLVEKSGWSFYSLGEAPGSLITKILSFISLNYKVFRHLGKIKPDLTLSHGSVHLSLMSWFRRIPHLSVEDTGNMEQVRLYRPFSKIILTPDSFQRNLGKKQIRYPGNHELAYLHPKRFTPDPRVLELLDVEPGEPYTIVRFVAWNASHDTGHLGISLENKIKAVKTFSQYSKVFISSEAPLPEELKVHKLPTPVEAIHNVLAFSSLMYGESASMASEAAVLGVPAIYLDNTGRCYTREEEEKYGLVFNYTESKEDQARSIVKGVELLKDPKVPAEWKKKRDIMLRNKIDVSLFFQWVIENWPNSFTKLKENSENRNSFVHLTFH